MIIVELDDSYDKNLLERLDVEIPARIEEIKKLSLAMASLLIQFFATPIKGGRIILKYKWVEPELLNYAIAVLSFAPGGVSILGKYWKSEHPQAPSRSQMARRQELPGPPDHQPDA